MFLLLLGIHNHNNDNNNYDNNDVVTVVRPFPTHSPFLKYFNLSPALNKTNMKPHTVLGSFLYEGHCKLGLKRINSADLASQFRRVIRPIVKKTVRPVSV